MKTALAIVCSFVLAATLFLPASAPAAGAGPAARCCSCNMPCCVARSSPATPPVSAVPLPSPSSNQLLTLAPDAVAWILPTPPAREVSACPALPSLTAGAPLFSRNCAWLI